MSNESNDYLLRTLQSLCLMITCRAEDIKSSQIRAGKKEVRVTTPKERMDSTPWPHRYGPSDVAGLL